MTKKRNANEQQHSTNTRTLRDGSVAEEIESLERFVTDLDELMLEVLERLEDLESRVDALEDETRAVPGEWEDVAEIQGDAVDVLTGEKSPDVADKIDELCGGPGGQN